MPTINRPKRKPKNLTINEQIRREIYNTTIWRKLRAAKLMQNPICEICLESGKTTIGIDVHHIISFITAIDPLKRKELAYAFDNLQTLCKECHQKVHN